MMQYLARAICFVLRPGGMADSPLAFKDFKEIQNSLSDARKITKFSLQPKELYNLTIKNHNENVRYGLPQRAKAFAALLGDRTAGLGATCLVTDVRRSAHCMLWVAFMCGVQRCSIPIEHQGVLWHYHDMFSVRPCCHPADYTVLWRQLSDWIPCCVVVIE